ncbi:MAG: hypothetical protein HY861_01635 [Chlamydiia bacterium]|nr:hypothetical protein [Chlamydiia bacterium]
MEISDVVENTYCQDIASHDGSESESAWNGRRVDLFTEDKTPLFRRANPQMWIRPMMSKPDRADVEISGGRDETRGGYVEGKISISWGDPKSSSDSQDKPSND